MENEPPEVTQIDRPHGASGRLTLAACCLLVGGALNNITIATQDMRDYRSVVFPAIALFAASGLLQVWAWRDQGAAGRAMNALLGLFLGLQLLDSVGRRLPGLL